MMLKDSKSDLNVPERDDWSHRRLRMDVVQIIYLGLLAYIILTGRANAVDQLAVPSLIAGIVAILGTYVFGSVWDYRSFLISKTLEDK